MALGLTVIAFAQPTRPVRVPREEATIVMAVDVSLSMEAADVEPDRITAAKAAAKSFVDIVPARLLVGLVAFSGAAQVTVSPTTDHELVKRSLENLILGPAPPSARPSTPAWRRSPRCRPSRASSRRRPGSC